jgi:hypothetical protein
VLTECKACGDPLFEYVAACPKCGTPNPTYEEDVADPKERLPPMERSAAGIVPMSFALTFVFGMAAAAHLPGPVPRELTWLFTTALAVTLSAGVFFLLGDRLRGNARRMMLLFIIGGYLALIIFAR